MLRGLLLFVLLGVPQIAVADGNGVDSRPYFPPLGCGSSVTGEDSGCHQLDANPEVMVAIEGPAEIELIPFNSGIYTISMPADTLGLEGAGMNAVIDDPNEAGCELDTWAPAGKQTLINDETTPSPKPVVSHRDDGNEAPFTLVGVWSYQVLVHSCTAPGSILLRAAMNAFDASGSEEGEAWNSTTLAVTVPEPGATLLGAGALGSIASLSRRRRGVSTWGQTPS